jgi:(p)ppGpp synthase/HD superfamily hydrolase
MLIYRGGSVSVWAEDKSRFKDYITAPKASGYQSLHMTLVHKESGIKMEVYMLIYIYIYILH